MNEQQLAAVKQSVESMTDADRLLEDEGYGRAYQQEAITALQSIIEQQPAPVQEPVAWVEYELGNHKKTAQPAPVQEPVVMREVLVKIARFLGVVRVYAQDIQPKHELETDKPLHWKARELQDEVIRLLDTTQPVPVKTYHRGKPWPVAPKPWVGLTEEELDTEATNHEQAHGFIQGAQWAEVKLKEKNNA
jgi:hypothetical protein